MDRSTQLTSIEMAQRHVTEGQRRVDKQERLVAELDRDGHDTTEARKLLGNLHITQKLHLEHRNRLLREFQPQAASVGSRQ